MEGKTLESEISHDRETSESMQREKLVVLWVSDLNPIGAEFAELKEILGDFTLVKRKAHDPSEIVNVARELKANVIILLPSPPSEEFHVAELFKMCQQLGIEVWRSKMEKIGEAKSLSAVTPKDYDPYMDRIMLEVQREIKIFGRIFRRESYAIYRFLGFYRIAEVECKRRDFKILKIATCTMHMQKVKLFFWWRRLLNRS